MATPSEIPFPPDWPGFASDDWRPSTRADCDRVPRPCPYVSCRYNLILSPRQPGQAWQMPLRPKMHVVVSDDDTPLDIDPRWSCALDVADAHPDGRSQKEIARHLCCTRQRIDQIETAALERIEEIEVMIDILFKRDGI